jgi:hypothetical protein
MAGRKDIKPRCAERIPAEILVKVVYEDQMIYGIATDVSETGMCIRVGQCLPGNAGGDVIIPVGNAHVRVPFMVRWSKVTDGFYDRMGVKLKRPPRKYKRIVEILKSSAPS